MNIKKIITMDGKLFYQAIVAGGKKIIENQDKINNINVFPVPDGDTGSNMSFTMKQIIEEGKYFPSYSKTIHSVAEAALDGARGNSGTIFSQFFYGLSLHTENNSMLSIKNFCNSCQKSIKMMYSSIGEPKEGTILSVAKDWSNYIYKNQHKFDDFVGLFQNALTEAKSSLKKTPELLETLKKNHVVDAGAQGFIYFLEGFLHFLKQGNFNANIDKDVNVDIKIKEHNNANNILELPTYRYCTEATIEAKNNKLLDKEQISKLILPFGNSSVIAGSPKKIKLHIHTNEPANLFEAISPLGNLTYQKAEDMRQQYNVAHEKKYSIAIVVDTSCELPQELLENSQVNIIPIRLSIGESNYLEKVTITTEQFNNTLKKVLQDKKSSYPTTSQPSQKTYEGTFRFLSNYYDHIICFSVGKKLSGTYNVAKKAADEISSECKKQIDVIDSANLSIGYGLLVYKAIKAIEKNISYADLLTNIEKWKQDIEFYVSLKTIKNLVRSGRLSEKAGKIAQFLHLKPIIVFKDGKASSFKNVLSQKKAFNVIFKQIEKLTTKQKKSIDEYMITHVNNLDMAKVYEKEMIRIFGKKPIGIINAAPNLSLHNGEGAVAVSFIYK